MANAGYFQGRVIFQILRYLICCIWNGNYWIKPLIFEKGMHCNILILVLLQHWVRIRIDFGMVTSNDSTSNIVLACVERVKEVQISTTKLSKPKGKKEAGKGDIFIATRGADCSQANRKRSRDFTLRFYHIWQSNYAISNCSFLCFLFNSFLQSRSVNTCPF